MFYYFGLNNLKCDLFFLPLTQQMLTLLLHVEHITKGTIQSTRIGHIWNLEVSNSIGAQHLYVPINT